MEITPLELSACVPSQSAASIQSSDTIEDSILIPRHINSKTYKYHMHIHFLVLLWYISCVTVCTVYHDEEQSASKI